MMLDVHGGLAQREGMAAFWCPIAPSANAMYDNFLSVKRRKTKEYRAWISTAGWRVREQKVRSVPGVRWAITIAAPIGHHRDLDNLMKPTIDLIQTLGIIPNDRWVDDVHVVRVTEGGTEMYVTVKALR